MVPTKDLKNLRFINFNLLIFECNRAIQLLNRTELATKSSGNNGVSIIANSTPSNHSSASVNHRRMQIEGYSDDIQSDAPSDSYFFDQCDISLLNCLDSRICAECYTDMQESGIDWANVASTTSCDTLIQVLTEQRGLCKDLSTSDIAQELFCQTFRACIDTQSSTTQQQREDDDNEVEDIFDCSTLKECSWPGMRTSYIGNGVCNDNLVGCYNSPACNYDGGDCCPDTCISSNSYMECGHEPYVCRNPNSSSCDNRLSNVVCKNTTGNDKITTSSPAPSCEIDHTLFKLVMYDSFGDGWESTKIEIKESAARKIIFSGGLLEGEVGEEFVCLATNAKVCYNVTVSGGMWGREISWEIRMAKNSGAPSIASGGAPMSCTFSAWGNSPDAPCPNTCTGRTSIDPALDPNYLDFKNIFNCIEDKCELQTAACKVDASCVNCYQEVIPDSCYTLDTFMAVSDCSTCKCGDTNSTDFCINKATPGALIPSINKATPGIVIPSTPIDENTYEAKPCTPAEVYQGGAAIVNFGNCSSLNTTPLLLKTLDQNKFGALDRFEACAHSYASRGTNTALGCLQILMNVAMSKGVDAGYDEGDKDAALPAEAIAALAESVYLHGNTFCDCAKQASIECPMCPSFVNFKTLLYETLDACNALDEIDCAAWDEYSKSCRNKIMSTFGEDQLSEASMNDGVCSYIKSGCGGVGAYPASFRRLDCAEEISLSSWDFYLTFRKKCLLDDGYKRPRTTLVPMISLDDAVDFSLEDDYSFEDSEEIPFSMETSKTSKETLPTTKTGYVPLEQRTSGSTASNSNQQIDYVEPVKKKTPWVRNVLIICILGYFGFYVYKKRTDSFAFVQYRRMGPRALYPSYDNDFDDATNGLAMTSTFQPPSLPSSPSS